MRIAMIGQKGIPSRSGGVEIHVEELAAGLAKSGVDVDVYCRKSYCDEIKRKHRGINLKHVPSINTKHLDAITYTILATIEALFKKYDIFHYHALGPSSMIWLPKMFGKKVVCTVHGLDWQRQKWGKFGRLYLKFGEKMIAKYASTIIVLSKSMQKYFKDKWNRDTVLIPNGVEVGIYKEAKIIKEKYGLEKNSYILFLARLVPEKGAHYLIKAFNEINTNKKLVIAGGSSHTDKYVRELRELGKSKNIVFTGFVKGDELRELFSNAYLYVLPSEIEGMPISLLEAISYGKCALISNIAENLEVINDTNFAFKSTDILSLKNKLELLLNNPKVVEEEGRKNLVKASTKYDWSLISNDTLEQYNQLYNTEINSLDLH